MIPGGSARLYRFGLFEADLENARLTRKGMRIRLQDQPFHILAMLLEHAGQIVTRDDLRHELWPAGTYVSFDSSLNAALNRLRVALDDDTDNPRFIETVPKHGYRFIAPVSVEVSPVATAPAGNGHPTDTPARRTVFPKRRWVLAAGIAAAVVVALVAFLALRKRGAPPSVSAEGKSIDVGSVRRSVAVLGFQNASGQPSDAWLSTALAEMLRTELGAGGKLRVVPGENVAQLRAGIPWPETDSLSRQTTAHIGKALDSDLLVLGSFAALTDRQNRTVRVDFRLQDARTGEILYEGAESASEKQFFGLAATVGTDLRQRLGLPMISESDEADVVSSLPSDPDANRLYSIGLEKLREGDVAAAKDILLPAEKQAPRFPLVHLMLYRAWAGLGYDQKAKHEIKTAYELSSGLPEVDRLQIEGAYYQSVQDHDKAISAYRALCGLYPESVDYADLLIAALHGAGRTEEALAMVSQLRKLPPPASQDPRIDYWQGELMASVGNSIGEPYFQKAAAEAGSRGEKLLYAQFRLHQCRDLVYSDHPQGGAAYCEEAYEIFMAAGNQLSAADALRTMGDRKGAKGDLNGARELYQQALAILRPMGEHEKTGVVLNNMAITYENQGQIAQAEELFRQAAETWTECGDLRNAGAARGNLGDVLMLRGQLSNAELQYNRARKQIEASDPNAIAYLLYSIANLRLYEGDIPGAQRYTAQAMAMADHMKNITDIASAKQTMGAIQIATDDLSGARQTLQQALAIREKQGDKGTVAEIDAALAEVSLEEGNFSQAEQVLRKSLAVFRSENTVQDEIETETGLSRVLLHERKLAGARQAISDAIALSASITDPNLNLPVAIMDARIQAAEFSSRGNAASRTDFSTPRRKLQNVLSTAHHLGYYQIECDARLALADLELRENSPSARTHLVQLERDARAHGLNLVSRKAAALENLSGQA